MMEILSGNKIIENMDFTKQTVIVLKDCNTIRFNNCNFDRVSLLGNVERLTFYRCKGNIVNSIIRITEIIMDNEGKCSGRLRIRNTKIEGLQKFLLSNKSELYYDAKFSALQIASEFTVINASFTLDNGELNCPTICLIEGATVNLGGEEREIVPKILGDIILRDKDVIEQNSEPYYVYNIPVFKLYMMDPVCSTSGVSNYRSK